MLKLLKLYNLTSLILTDTTGTWPIQTRAGRDQAEHHCLGRELERSEAFEASDGRRIQDHHREIRERNSWNAYQIDQGEFKI